VHWDDIAIFVEIARQSGISAAARQLGMPKSRISKALAALEARLGVRLVERTSRQFRLTELGQAYARQAEAAFLKLLEAETFIEASRQQPSGRLCISAPIIFGHTYLGPILAEFTCRFPNVDVEVRLENRMVDLIEEGVDVAVRSGRLADSTLIARPLDTARLQLAAQLEVADALAGLVEPSEIRTVPLIQAGGSGRAISMSHLDGRSSVVTISRFPSFNDVALVRSYVEDAGCVALLPTFVLEDALGRGRLTLVLPDWSVVGTDALCVLSKPARPVPKNSGFRGAADPGMRQVWQTVS
jgi:DNA-binding transcriptional LysR family regulator